MNCQPNLFHDDEQKVTHGALALEKELIELLEDFATKYEAYELAGVFLGKYLRTESLNPEQSVQTVVNSWIKTKCDQATRQVQQKHHLIIEPSSLPEDLQSLVFRGRRNSFEIDARMKAVLSTSIYEAPVREVVQCALLRYDAQALFHALEKAKTELGKTSMEDAAHKLSKEFRLNTNYSRTSPLQIKRQKGRYIIESYFIYEHHRNWTEYRDLVAPANTFELETGIEGFLSCFKSLFEACYATSNNFESRTKFNVGSDVEAVVYKEKIKYHLSPSAFEALISFLTDHCPDTLRELEVE
ncbi:hypothetical protein [Pseudovibrio sp. Ad37]|uniref:hypothetical protein n=1 Tax=Pseudovibrio sp. Ad37 TaxID=989422 RepID=UPI0007AE5E62|nr:hypothetical protein [Pseudovibrio sp. Ad37]KZL22675.1 hypothetical protein PsAD37_03323 [Pseudovibrio sp. Ad37]